MINDIERLNIAFSGRYSLQRVLGRNGWIVYIAQDLLRHHEAALWVTEPASSARSERFLREIAGYGQLRHPNIRQPLDFGREAEILYYAVANEGGSLRARLRPGKQLPVDDALRITRQAAEALAYAHDRGFVHGDVTPDNIVIEGDQARVADFEWRARRLRSDAETATQSGVVVGRLEYVGPEQITDADHAGHRADIYSLACVLYEMLALKPPLVASDSRVLRTKVLEEIPPPIRRLRPELSAAIEGALARGLAKRPADRFATTLEFCDALESKVER